jgi:uracil phosphoribosyltransferase
VLQMRLQIQRSTEFAIQQLIQSVFTLSVLGRQKDIDVLKQLIETQNDPDEDKQILVDNEALVPILRALIAKTE